MRTGLEELAARKKAEAAAHLADHACPAAMPCHHWCAWGLTTMADHSGEAASGPYVLRTTPTARRALSETLPEAVAVAAYEFMTGPLLADPYRVRQGGSGYVAAGALASCLPPGLGVWEATFHCWT
jgi:hypothetical protein